MKFDSAGKAAKGAINKYRKFDEFIVDLQDTLRKPLPGLLSQLKLAPFHRIEELQQDVPADAIESSVMILLYPFDN
jgi:hypothetical protein